MIKLKFDNYNRTFYTHFVVNFRHFSCRFFYKNCMRLDLQFH